MLPGDIGGCAVVAGAAAGQAVFERQPAVGLFPAECFDEFPAGGAGPVCGEDGLHGVDDADRCLFHDGQFGRAFAGAQALEDELGVGDFNVLGLVQDIHSFHRQEGCFDADADLALLDVVEVGCGGSNGVGCSPAGGFDALDPDRVHFELPGFHGVGNVGAGFRMVPEVKQHGKVPAHADGVHVVEEEEPVTSEEVLDVVFGGDEQYVQVCLVHEAVKVVVVERNIHVRGPFRVSIHCSGGGC